MIEMDAIRLEMERIKADPPNLNETPVDTGNKLIRLFDLVVRLCDKIASEGTDTVAHAGTKTSLRGPKRDG